MHSVKTIVSNLHMNYLLSNTSLLTHNYSSFDFKPDLIGPNNETFELKTKTFPQIQLNSTIQKGRLQYEWF